MEKSSGFATSAEFPFEVTGFSRTLRDVTIEDEIVEDATTVTVIDRFLYQQKGTDLEPIGCFRCFRDKKTGSFVCVPIQCPPDKPKPDSKA